MSPPPTQVEPKRVLVTGSAGYVGRAACRELRHRGHTVRGFDVKPTPDVDDHVVASIADRNALDAAMADMSAVVHLAAYPDDGDFVTQILPNNYLGLYHVLEAAREAKIPRVVLASSMQVILGLDPAKRPLYIEDGAAPTNHYALSKLLAEEMGRMYARKCDMSIIAVRIGWMPRTAEWARRQGESEAGKNYYISPPDTGRFLACCVEAVDVDFAILFATSRPTSQTLIDIAAARDLIGYEPLHTFPEGAPRD